MIQITGWHGDLKNRFGEKIEKLFPSATFIERTSKCSESYLIEDKNLSDFALVWDEKFMCYPMDYGHLINITHFSNFGQR